ncbi:MAG: AAA family ATPase, partial [Desulfovibrio sp.]|nr:AAA family ATPase [Desulfovibrio sp.]
MHIESFHIDGFGVFSGVTVEALSPGLSVFLGENEAGKSTCLEFLRVTLAGYPDRRGNAWKPYAAYLEGGKTGGSLALRLREGQALRLTRRPGAGGGILTLGDGNGRTLPSQFLNELLRGVSRDVYNAVFGFSLAELQIFESLSDPGVRNALYSASFGPGLASPGAVLAGFNREMEGIFKPGGANPALNADIKALEDIRRRLEELRARSASYNDLARELERNRTALAEARRKKAGLEVEERGIARRLGVWRQWRERHVALARLDRLEAVGEDFPEDGPARLAALETARQGCERRLAERREKCSRLEQRLEAIRVDPALPEALPLLRGLASRRNACQEALALLPGQREECRRAAAQFRAELRCLGRGWTCARIRATDRTLFAREDVEKQARAMTAAALTYNAALDVLHKANQEVPTAEEGLESARLALALLPSPEAVLNEEERDKTRQALDRRDAGLRSLAGRQKSVDGARALFARAFEPLGIKKTADPAGDLEGVLARREEALGIAGEVQERQREAEKLEEAARQAENQAHDLKLRKKLHLEDLQRNPPDGSRKSLDDRERALDELRGKSAALDMERGRLDELDGRIHSETPPSPVKSLPLIAVGLVLALLGAGMLLAHWRLGITSYALTERLVVPVTLWSGYLILVCGVAFLAGGLPRSGPEAKRHRQQMAQLRKSRETLAERVARLEEQTTRLCAALGMENRDPVTLDAVALRLKDEREKIVLGEQSRKALDDLEREVTLAEARFGEAARRRDQHMNSRVQHVRRRWQDIMLALGVRVVPSADGAAAFFAKVETARIALATLQEADAALRGQEADIRAQEDILRSQEPVFALTGNPADGESLARSGRLILESCRAADAAREERIRAEAAVQAGENALADSRARRDKAARVLREAEERLARAREQWRASLGKMGLDVDLEPDAVREAFNRMDKCLAAEDRLLRCISERRRSRGAVRALCLPLAELLEKIGRLPQKDIDGKDDWPASLDAALEAAESAFAASGERGNLAKRLEEEREAARNDEAALREAQDREAEFFARAGARDANDFLRLNRVRDERFELNRSVQQNEEMLR